MRCMAESLFVTLLKTMYKYNVTELQKNRSLSLFRPSILNLGKYIYIRPSTDFHETTIKEYF
jgi:hypothetical protein